MQRTISYIFMAMAITVPPTLAWSNPPIPDGAVIPNGKVRTIDGKGNNRQQKDWGKAHVPLLRLAEANYADGVDQPAGQDRASARLASNELAATTGEKPNKAGASDMLWQWGQFIDHDFGLTEPAPEGEAFPIDVPQGDRFFDPASTGSAIIPLTRSEYRKIGGQREQLNGITAFIDASNVYGSDRQRANALRKKDGSGKLKTSRGKMLPFNTRGLANAPSSSPNFFLAGDIRANEQVGLLALHTLFVREHNFIAEQLKAKNPGMSGDDIYQSARALVAAQMQAITYNEFLPVLLGKRGMPAYRGYNKNVDPSLANEFSTAAFRFGHSMLSPTIARLDKRGRTISQGDLALRDAFFQPTQLVETGLAPVLRGLAGKHAQEIDHEVVDDIRNFLFGPPGAGGFDLASLNIQRGRDHGIPSLNALRQAVGLRPITQFHHLTGDFELAKKFEKVYGSVDNIDPWIGGLAELKHPRSMLGRTFYKVVQDQFIRLRDGDRFWYQTYLPQKWVKWVEKQTLSEIIKRNTAAGNELSKNVFLVPNGRRR